MSFTTEALSHHSFLWFVAIWLVHQKLLLWQLHLGMQIHLRSSKKKFNPKGLLLNLLLRKISIICHPSFHAIFLNRDLMFVSQLWRWIYKKDINIQTYTKNTLIKVSYLCNGWFVKVHVFPFAISLLPNSGFAILSGNRTSIGKSLINTNIRQDYCRTNFSGVYSGHAYVVRLKWRRGTSLCSGCSKIKVVLVKSYIL